MSHFIECEFRGCKWKNIGLSGNSTNIERCLITNPEKFIRAGYTNTDASDLKRNNKTLTVQLCALEETKSTVSRNIYNSHKITGDDDSFYRSCKIYTLQSIRSKIHRVPKFPTKWADIATEQIKRKTRYFYLFEYIIMYTFGQCNRWGSSASLPLVLLALNWLAFSVVYFLGLEYSLVESISKSFEISSIAGYTKGATSTDFGAERTLEWLNLSISIILYTIFFATTTTKVSRVR